MTATRAQLARRAANGEAGAEAAPMVDQRCRYADQGCGRAFVSAWGADQEETHAARCAYRPDAVARPKVVCRRCQGTGQHSFNGHHSRCYGCGGRGWIYGKAV